MTQPKSTLITLQNDKCSLSIDLFGGAIIDFRLNQNIINPLSFSFSKQQMPLNNQSGANYQGHCLCLGRWGLPSSGEIKAGIPNHGQFANILWTAKNQQEDLVQMDTVAALEGLAIERKILLDKNNPVWAVKEVVKNINSIGRLYSMVQHPTLGAPFLDGSVIIDCNASKGFDQALYKDVENNTFHWPIIKDSHLSDFHFNHSTTFDNAVYSFIVDPESEYGWISAYSPNHQLLFGYIWKRKHYSWIHLWQHWDGNQIKYRGLEFGNTGIHQPFKEILATATNLFGEDTFDYIDAGETVSRNYFSFLCPVETDFVGVENIQIINDTIQIKSKVKDTEIIFKLTSELFHELSK